MKKIIESTVISPWCRRKIIEVNEFLGFPKCIASIIAEYAMVPKLLDWINPNLLDYMILYENPKAVESGMIDLRGSYGSFVVTNPAASDYVKANWARFKFDSYIWANPALFDFVIEMGEAPCYEALGCNPNPKAIKRLIDDGMCGWIDENNPSALEYLRQSGRDISRLYGNSAAIDYLGDFTGHGSELSDNSHQRAIEYLRTHQDEIHWSRLSRNPGIFEYSINPELLELLSE